MTRWTKLTDRGDSLVEKFLDPRGWPTGGGLLFLPRDAVVLDVEARSAVDQLTAEFIEAMSRPLDVNAPNRSCIRGPNGE